MNGPGYGGQANGPGYGDQETWGPCVSPRDPRWRETEPEEQYTPAGLLHECNRLIAKANDAMAANNVASSKAYLRLLAGEIQHALGYHD